MQSECDYCIKHEDHDGKCGGKYNNHPCLLYERDPRGKWNYKDNCLLPVLFSQEIPGLFKDIDLYVIGIIQILVIDGFEWYKDSRGLHGIYLSARIRYWSDTGTEPIKRKLELVKR